MSETTEQMLARTQEMLLDLSRQLDAVLSDRDTRMDDRPWTKLEAAQWLGIHPDTLKDYRKQWTEGIHYFRLLGGECRYNPEMVKDWLENRSNPQAHERAIAVWNARRLCNQSTRNQRRKAG